MKKIKRNYSEEFKQNTVNYYYSYNTGKSIKAAASDLKISQCRSDK